MHTQHKHTLFTAIFMQVAAILYLYMIDSVFNNGLPWDSELGHILLTPALLLTGYAWIMLLLSSLGIPKVYTGDQYDSIQHNPQVMENKGDWKAKDVHWLSKFTF